MVNIETVKDKAQVKIYLRSCLFGLLAYFKNNLNISDCKWSLISTEHLRPAGHWLGHHANVYLDVIKFSKVLDRLPNNCTSANWISLQHNIMCNICSFLSFVLLPVVPVRHKIDALVQQHGKGKYDEIPLCFTHLKRKKTTHELASGWWTGFG